MKLKIQNRITATLCATHTNPTNNETDRPSDMLENKLENKSVSTVNYLDKETITTPPFLSTRTPCQTDSRNPLFLDNYSTVPPDSRTSIDVPRDLQCFADCKTSPDNEEIVSIRSCQSKIGSPHVHEQKPPVDKASMKESNLEITEALSLTLSQLENDQGNNSDHTRGFHDALHDTHSLATKSLTCQTDVQSCFQFVNLDAPSDEQVFSSSSTISCQTDTHVSSNQSCLPTAKLSEVFCVPIDDQMPTADSLHSSASCQIDQSIHEHHLTTKNSKEVVDPNSPVNKQISVSTVSCQTDSNCLRNTTVDESVRTLDSGEKNVKTDEVIRAPEHLRQMEKTPTECEDKLDFNLLNEIDFGEVKSVLGTLPSKQVSDILTSSSQQDGNSTHASDDELMLKLSDLSRDQLSACSGVLDDKEDNMAESMYQKKRKFKANRGSAKAIHTWSQLSSDDSFAKEPETIYLDLRPEKNSEKRKVLYIVGPER